MFSGVQNWKVNSGKSCLLRFISALTSNLLLMHVSKSFPRILSCLWNCCSSSLILDTQIRYERWPPFEGKREKLANDFSIDWNPEQSRLQSRSDCTYHRYICLMSRSLLCCSFSNDNRMTGALVSISEVFVGLFCSAMINPSPQVDPT